MVVDIFTQLSAPLLHHIKTSYGPVKRLHQRSKFNSIFQQVFLYAGKL